MKMRNRKTLESNSVGITGKLFFGANSWGPLLRCKYGDLDKYVDFYFIQEGEENPKKLALQVKDMFKPYWKQGTSTTYDVTGKLSGNYDRMVFTDFVFDDVYEDHPRIKITDNQYKFIDYLKELGKLSESDRRKLMNSNRVLKKIEEILN